MASWVATPEVVEIAIPEAVNEDQVTWYEIAVKIRDVEWRVKRRYREFFELHEAVVNHGVDKDSLPEKKLIGNREPSFIMRRRKELESYIQSVFRFLLHSLPKELADFLLLTEFDDFFILRELASRHYDTMAKDHNQVDTEDAHGVDPAEADLSPLQLHAISMRMKSAVPPEDNDGDKRYDFTNVADMACGLQALSIRGSPDPVGSSNIVPNDLNFDFLAFKSLTKLILKGVNCSPERIEALGMTRKTLKHLEATECGLKSIADILLCDTPHMDIDSMDDDPAAAFVKADNKAKYGFDSLEYLNVRGNAIARIDVAINLAAPKLRTLLMGGNRVTLIENLSDLPELSVLELADNAIDNIDDLNTKLGQLTKLDLANNKIRNLAGASKMYSLQELNVASNKIHDMESVTPVTGLPNLESLNLQGNHVTTVVDYRLKVFESVGKRCSDLCLDNELPSQPEIDKVSVLMALRVAKEGKAATSLFGNLPRRV